MVEQPKKTHWLTTTNLSQTLVRSHNGNNNDKKPAAQFCSRQNHNLFFYRFMKDSHLAAAGDVVAMAVLDAKSGLILQLLRLWCEMKEKRVLFGPFPASSPKLRSFPCVLTQVEVFSLRPHRGWGLSSPDHKAFSLVNRGQSSVVSLWVADEDEFAHAR